MFSHFKLDVIKMPLFRWFSVICVQKRKMQKKKIYLKINGARNKSVYNCNIKAPSNLH